MRKTFIIAAIVVAAIFLLLRQEGTVTSAEKSYPPPNSIEECVDEWTLGARYVHCTLNDINNCEIGEECPVLWEAYCRCDFGAWVATIDEDGNKTYELDLRILPDNPHIKTKEALRRQINLTVFKRLLIDQVARDAAIGIAATEGYAN